MGEGGGASVSLSLESGRGEGRGTREEERTDSRLAVIVKLALYKLQDERRLSDGRLAEEDEFPRACNGRGSGRGGCGGHGWSKGGGESCESRGGSMMREARERRGGESQVGLGDAEGAGRVLVGVLECVREQQRVEENERRTRTNENKNWTASTTTPSLRY